jgi:aspartyl-tRNA(Asn)/glutamyl-tRNA(Gln) amidotransferase subunit C
MESNIDLILRLEKLANLQLDPSERAAMASDLEKMIAMISQLSTLDTSGVEPLVYLSTPIDAMRADVPQEPQDPEEALSLAPDRKGPYFIVPKVSMKPAE